MGTVRGRAPFVFREQGAWQCSSSKVGEEESGSRKSQRGGDEQIMFQVMTLSMYKCILV